MTAAANNKLGRSEAVRWTVCFAVVVAAHALVALSLFPTLEASEFEAGAPVIMLELPAAPAAPSTPPSDLAPGPPEEQSDPTPPPKEETKPIEQEAEGQR
jgi:protein TonB